MPDHAWSRDDDSEVVAAVEATVAALSSVPSVHVGSVPAGTVAPFVVCWPLQTYATGESVAVEDAGVRFQEWQIGGHGRTTGEMRWIAEAIAGGTWPDGWRLVDVGPTIEDTEESPSTWWVPLTFRCERLTGG